MPDPRLTLGLTALIVLLASLLFWPRQGLVYRWRRARELTDRVLLEDALKHIHHCEMGGRRPTTASVAGALQIGIAQAAELLATIEAAGLLITSPVEDEHQAQDFHLTPRGRETALHIIRAHRLWERFLADQTGYDELEWHEQAERLEHQLRPAEADALSARLGNPTHDPHGDPIPDSTGEFVGHGGQPLTALDLDQPARIVHLEDEPETVYAQLVAEGLHLGMEVRLTEISPQRVCFWANGDQHVLAPGAAANIAVKPLPKEIETSWMPTGRQLSELHSGQHARVVAISPRCRGPNRRRLMDLGILPGTLVTAEMTSPSGDPTAYRVRETLIALRRDQASLILVSPIEEVA